MKFIKTLLLMLTLITTSYAAPNWIDLRDYGATLNGSGVGDSDALQSAVTAINTGLRPTNHIYWNGNLTLTRVPPMLDRHYLHGDNIYGSIISKKYPGAWYLRWQGRPGYSGGGLSDCSIPTDQYSPGSYMVILRATADGYAPDGFELKNVYLGSGIGANAPFRTIDVNGSYRVSPYGVRQVRFNNVTCFGGTGGCTVYIDGTADFIAKALRCYPGGAPYGNVYLGPVNHQIVLD